MSDWRPIDSAPKEGPCPDVLLRYLWRGRVCVAAAHWAFGDQSEIGGPPFGPGWFQWDGSGFSEIEDAEFLGWMPMPR